MADRLFDLDAVLFDLDGVLTSTAALHQEAWKRAFDEALIQLSGAGSARQLPFDDEDYRLHVDGRPREEGIRNFLTSRGIELPECRTDKSVAGLTVAEIAERKNDMFQQRLEAGTVDAFPGSLALLSQLRSKGVRTAVVSASRNCRAVIKAAGIDEMFDAVVDGQVAANEGLRGKPAPDTFLAAAGLLGTSPARAAVVDDALAGVEAGRAGAFGLVIGVDRTGVRERLLEHGADVVVSDLAELLEPPEPTDR